MFFNSNEPINGAFDSLDGDMNGGIPLSQYIPMMENNIKTAKRNGMDASSMERQLEQAKKEYANSNKLGGSPSPKGKFPGGRNGMIAAGVAGAGLLGAGGYMIARDDNRNNHY